MMPTTDWPLQRPVHPPKVKDRRMDADIDRVLITRLQIAARVAELAARITADHTFPDDNSEITIIPILTGAMIFCGDLIRQIPIAMKIGLLTVSSYPGYSITNQGVEVLHRRLGDVKDRHVVVVDDILDSGQTMKVVVQMIKDLGASTVRSCVLLRKDRAATRDVSADYVGFDIPDEFVVGYGLDYNSYYRNLPDIVTLKRSVLEARP